MTKKSVLTKEDRAFIESQMPQLKRDYWHNPQRQARLVSAIGAELSSKAARDEWLQQAGERFP